MTGTTRKFALMAVALLLVAGCSSDDKEQLSGERLSVLVHARQLEPDPELRDQEILLPPPAPNPDWPQAGGYANHAMHHLEVGDSLREVWRADVGAAADDEERLVATPIVAEGKLFALDAETDVTALDAETGKRLWEAELTPEDEEDGHIGGGIAYENGKVFVASGYAEVIALDAETGKVLWRHRVDAPMRAAPTARGGRVFAITLDNQLFALNGETGEVLWTYRANPEVATLLGGASPAVDQGIIVAPFSSGELVALRVESGRDIWTDSLASVRRTDVLSSLSQIRGRPIVDRNRVYAISHSGLTAAIDLRSGQRIWDAEIGGPESPWIAGDYLFLLTNDSDLLCLSRDTGRIFWIRPLPRFEDPDDKEDPIVWTGPILASDRLIVAGSQGTAYAVSPYDGRVIGEQELPDGVSVAPIVAGNTLYVLTDDAEIVALR